MKKRQAQKAKSNWWIIVLAVIVLAAIIGYVLNHFDRDTVYSTAKPQVFDGREQVPTAVSTQATPINNGYSVDKKTGSVTIVIPRQQPRKGGTR